MKYFKNLKNEKILGDAFKVLTGSVLSQAITIAILPILTRNLGQEVIGNYFVWLGIGNILIVIATGRLDMAIFVVNTKGEVAFLLKLIASFAALVCLLVIIFGSILMPFFNLRFENTLFEQYFLSLSFLTFFSAILQGVISYYIYTAEYIKLGWVKFGLALFVNLSVLLASIFLGSVSAIIYSHLLATIIFVSVLLRFSGISGNHLFSKLEWNKLLSTLKRHYRFPLFSMPADFINSLSAQLPLFLILSNFGSSSVALFGIILRVLSGPIGLLASSMLTVFKEHAGRDFREIGNCKAIYLRTLKLLILLGIVPFTILFFFSPAIFTFIFGESWRAAGEYAVILVPMFFFKFVVSPLSYTLYISDKQFVDLVWQLGLLLITWCSFYFTNSLFNALLSYSVGYSAMYLIYFVISYNSATNSKFLYGSSN